MSELKAMEGERKTGREIETAIQGLRDRNLVTEERLLGQLFRGYFNNKMTVLIFLCHAVHHKPEENHVRSICCFLDDIYRHMIEGLFQRQYRRKFIWLKGFLQKVPNVRASQRAKAINLVQSLYNIFGINLNRDF